MVVYFLVLDLTNFDIEAFAWLCAFVLGFSSSSSSDDNNSSEDDDSSFLDFVTLVDFLVQLIFLL